MNHRGGSKPLQWFPLYIDSWLLGSARHELIIEENGVVKDLRGIFVDLLALSKKDSGFIRANPETPYRLRQLAGLFCVPESDLKKCIDICVAHDKLTDKGNGIYYVTNHDQYQFSESYLRKLGAGKDNSAVFVPPQYENPILTPSKTRPIIHNNTVHNKTEQDICAKAPKPKTLLEVKTYFEELKSPDPPNDSASFFDHFEANGWKQGGRAAMKDWRAAARQWVRNIPKFSGSDKASYDDKLREHNKRTIYGQD